MFSSRLPAKTKKEKKTLSFCFGPKNKNVGPYDTYRTQGRMEARARFRAEALAVEQGETLPPIANPSPAMLLYYNYLMARRGCGWEQHQATDVLASSADSTSDLVARSVNAVAHMHWCIDNLWKIRADVGDSRHSDWSDCLLGGRLQKDQTFG